MLRARITVEVGRRPVGAACAEEVDAVHLERATRDIGVCGRLEPQVRARVVVGRIFASSDVEARARCVAAGFEGLRH